MAEMKAITDHQEIREWAEARNGKPALRQPPPIVDDQDPVAVLVFGYRPEMVPDVDNPSELLEIVEWDEWFEIFESHHLALMVPVSGVIDETHHLVRRS